MQFNAQQIASMLGGTIEGDPNAIVHTFAKIEDAQNGALCFFANPKYEPYLYSTHASIVLLASDFVLKHRVAACLIRVKEPYAAFAKLLQQYEAVLKQGYKKMGIEEPSYISPKATIGANVYIGAFCYIDDDAAIGDNSAVYPNSYIGRGSTIGSNTTLHAGVKVYHECHIGNNCLIHAGAVIGSDGFGFAQSAATYQKVPQLGNVVIEDDVEIGANCCLDRATLGSTTIHRGVKFDNMVQIAHNVTIGANTVIAGLTAVSGSTKIGEHCLIGGQAGFVGHISIADGTMINGRSGVAKTITTPGLAFTGSPAMEYKNAMKSQVVYKNLPKLQQQLSQLEQELAALKAQIIKD
jgi:UDP-3-O-[3-hydroxymyristoyl] glucosamine N-acyltransferase